MFKISTSLFQTLFKTYLRQQYQITDLIQQQTINAAVIRLKAYKDLNA